VVVENLLKSDNVPVCYWNITAPAIYKSWSKIKVTVNLKENMLLTFIVGPNRFSKNVTSYSAKTGSEHFFDVKD
jgi:hypothetical protein